MSLRVLSSSDRDQMVRCSVFDTGILVKRQS